MQSAVRHDSPYLPLLALSADVLANDFGRLVVLRGAALGQPRAGRRKTGPASSAQRAPDHRVVLGDLQQVCEIVSRFVSKSRDVSLVEGRNFVTVDCSDDRLRELDDGIKQSLIFVPDGHNEPRRRHQHECGRQILRSHLGTPGQSQRRARAPNIQGSI
eukprot:5955797-Prymnesium_polylepis.3